MVEIINGSGCVVDSQPTERQACIKSVELCIANGEDWRGNPRAEVYAVYRDGMLVHCAATAAWGNGAPTYTGV